MLALPAGYAWLAWPAPSRAMTCNILAGRRWASQPDLEQEHVLSAVGAMDGELAGPLLGGDDMQLGCKGCNGHHWLACQIGPRHCQLQALRDPVQSEVGERTDRLDIGQLDIGQCWTIGHWTLYIGQLDIWILDNWTFGHFWTLDISVWTIGQAQLTPYRCRELFGDDGKPGQMSLVCIRTCKSRCAER